MCNFRIINMKKLILFFYLNLICKFPCLEILVRHIYWYNYSLFKKFKPAYKSVCKNDELNFDLILNILKSYSLEGKIVIVHSSYDALKNTGLSPECIVDKLIELVGKNGTLVMPAIRRYKEVKEYKYNLSLDENLLSGIECVYRPRKTMITTGLLPYTLLQKKGSSVSLFPLSPAVAYGKDAEAMMKHNLDGFCPSPHGPNSAWKYCVDNNAVVIGLGVDLSHFLTVMHTHDECSLDWPIKKWFRYRKFFIDDSSTKRHIIVRERIPRWGQLFSADGRFKNDLLSNNILHVDNLSDFEISIVKSKELIDFMDKHKDKTYPYYIPKIFYK